MLKFLIFCIDFKKVSTKSSVPNAQTRVVKYTIIIVIGNFLNVSLSEFEMFEKKVFNFPIILTN